MTEMHTPSTVGGYALGWDTYGPPAAPTRLEHSGNLLTFGAYQAVLPERGYGIALLFNSGSAFLLEQTAIFRGALQATATTIFRSWQMGCHLRILANVPARPGQAAPRLTVLRKGRPEESP